MDGHDDSSTIVIDTIDESLWTGTQVALLPGDPGR